MLLFSIFLTQYDGMFLGPIAKLLGLIINVIFNFLSIFGIENAALCIILFTFIVKVLMFPLTIKQQKFSKLSSTMSPELTAIQAKYKGKKDEASMRKQQVETQAVYQKYGVSPTSGCLPMLITLPIMFALYRVIYNIPAYIDSIRLLYENIAVAIENTPGYAALLGGYIEKLNITGKNDWGDITQAIPINHIIDTLAVFKTSDWVSLKETFPTLSDIITTNSNTIMNINSLPGGLNIANPPGFGFPGILIPIGAMVFQFLSGKQMERQNPTDPNNSAAGTMKAMNTFMPIMSGVFCITFPIGIGLYWIASSVFQILQQFIITKYMNSVDVQELIDKNVEKARKKKIRKGIDPDASMEDLARKSTKSIREVPTITDNKSTSNYANKKTNFEPSNYKKSEVSYKAGSISANAHILSRDKGDKK